MSGERGFTLIEVLVTLGIVASIAIGGLGYTLSSRSLAVAAAAMQFDALLSSARTTAGGSSYGVTIDFVPDAYGDGFVARVYDNRPGTAALTATTLPALAARVSVVETQTLGAAPFAFALHANGSVGGIAGSALVATRPETPCPASGVYHLVFSYGGARAQRDIPCSTALATTGPPVLAPLPPELPLPLPTAPPCAGGCATVPPTPPPGAGTPVPIAIYFAGPASVQMNEQPGSEPQPCTNFPLFDHAGAVTGDEETGGWYEDDWYVETIATTAGTLLAQHGPGAGGWWTFAGDSFGVPGGTYLDPTQVGSAYHAVGTYGASTSLAASALPLAGIGALPPATAVIETDYLHESCYAAWSSTPG